MPLLALKIDVDTFRGTLQGVPHLVEILHRHGADATFLFSLGRDHTGRAIRRAFRPGFMKKVSRTSVVSHYGLKTLMYGTLLPGPDIGRGCADILRGVRDAGFEVGIHCWDHVKWQDGVVGADMDWTEHEMRLACTQFTDVFGTEPIVHGAAGWQMNRHALRMTQRLGFHYASDCRGSHPFMPVWNAEVVHCPQLPTTLPTLDELIGVDNVVEDNVHERLLELTESPPATGHVYTLHAELEGMKLAPMFERLLLGWKQQGYELVSLQKLYAGIAVDELPRHEVLQGEIPGRSGNLLLQGPEFLADAGR
ncbi:putative 4-deoxy-4-formamido-L-arabinose-phosphoundecaprenol deformylase ArnD [Georgfuchsia toluolica]|uniref:4-deoxy-4-formamido-L-arabinose-phosphoundecaprenol deformylase ArnD n=1 Tax=Georgfuchsia toluolica TaxID=424218 RepID=A0A916J4D7_9PROT|nr:polysaccharide deacetylase family protein [Georgfuchsia toluolica]CAG4882990.1 putative 4-deoxy-4-formamido-L-arabinose-phosphoundecaprenol deformylase ArnD [Georgfuchsia toluolica]